MKLFEGSCVREENRQVMGNSTLEVVGYYLDADLSPSQDNKEPPDHVATEMEFMYYLAFHYLKCGERRFAEKEKQFFLSYAYSWGPRFATDIAHSKFHPSYCSLAEVTIDFLALEANRFNQTNGI